MDNNQEQSNVSQKAQGAYGKYQNLRLASSLGKRLAFQVGSKIATTVAASTIEFWGPVAIVGITIGIGIITFAIVFSGGPTSLEAEFLASPTPFVADIPSPIPSLTISISPTQSP